MHEKQSSSQVDCMHASSAFGLPRAPRLPPPHERTGQHPFILSSHLPIFTLLTPKSIPACPLSLLFIFETSLMLCGARPRPRPARRTAADDDRRDCRRHGFSLFPGRVRVRDPKSGCAIAVVGGARRDGYARERTEFAEMYTSNVLRAPTAPRVDARERAADL